MSKKRGDPSDDLEYRILAEYRNVAGWVGTGLGLLALTIGICNNFQSEAYRITAAILGAGLCFLYALFTIWVHAHLVHARVGTFTMAVLLANVGPTLVWFIGFFATEEYKVAQNKV